jgi:hypothetical protein
MDRAADLGKVQEWLGHANVSTTRLCAGTAAPGGHRHIPRPLLN